MRAAELIRTERDGGRLPPEELSKRMREHARGEVRATDARALGEAVVDLAGGRPTADAVIHMRVGLDRVRALGDALRSAATAPTSRPLEPARVLPEANGA